MTYFVFIDESGNLLDPLGRYFVIAAIGTPSPRELSNIVKKTRAWLKQRGKRYQNVGELRFFSVGSETRSKFFELLAETSNTRIFLLIVEKDRIPDKNAPEQFARASWPIFQRILSEDSQVTFVLDKQFTNPAQREIVNRSLESRAGRRLNIEHGDSQTNPCLQIADFVAGAGMAKYQREEGEYLELVRSKISLERVILWSEIEKW
jgi:hypothetical protein